MNDLKSGILTTEFWATLIGSVMAVLLAAHVVSSADATSLAGSATQAVTAVFTVVGSLMTIVHYVQGRIVLKSMAPARGVTPPLP